MKPITSLLAALVAAAPLVAIAQTGAATSPNAPGASTTQPTVGRMNTATGVDATDTHKNVAKRRVAKRPVVKKDADSGPGDPSARPNAVSRKDGKSG